MAVGSSVAGASGWPGNGAQQQGPAWTAKDVIQWRTIRWRYLTPGGTANNVPVTTSATTLAVTFLRAEQDTKYGVAITPNWNTTVWVTSKATTGFTANFGTAAPANATVDWSVNRAES